MFTAFFIRNYFNIGFILNIIYFIHTFGNSEAFTISTYPDQTVSNHFTEITVMFIRTPVLIKMPHLLNPLKYCSYLHFSLYIFISLSCIVLSASFNRNIESSSIYPIISLFFVTPTSIINKVSILSEYSTLHYMSERVVSPVNKVLFSLVTVS